MHFTFYACGILYISPHSSDPEKFILSSVGTTLLIWLKLIVTSIAHGQSLPGLLLAYNDVMHNLLGLFVAYILLV